MKQKIIVEWIFLLLPSTLGYVNDKNRWQYVPIGGCSRIPRLHRIVVIWSETTAARRSRSWSIICRSSIAQAISWVLLQRCLILSFPFLGLLFFSQNCCLFGAFVGNFLLSLPSFSHFFSTITILFCCWFCGWGRQGISFWWPTVGIWTGEMIRRRTITENLKVRMDLLPHDKARIPSTFYTRSTYNDRWNPLWDIAKGKGALWWRQHFPWNTRWIHQWIDSSRMLCRWWRPFWIVLPSKARTSYIDE